METDTDQGEMDEPVRKKSYWARFCRQFDFLGLLLIDDYLDELVPAKKVNTLSSGDLEIYAENIKNVESNKYSHQNLKILTIFPVNFSFKTHSINMSYEVYDMEGGKVFHLLSLFIQSSFHGQL